MPPKHLLLDVLCHTALHLCTQPAPSLLSAQHRRHPHPDISIYLVCCPRVGMIWVPASAQPPACCRRNLDGTSAAPSLLSVKRYRADFVPSRIYPRYRLIVIECLPMCAAPSLLSAQRYGADFASFPHIAKYVAIVAQRPSVQETWCAVCEDDAFILASFRSLHLWP